jgi:demethylmenaquinone methyltransferase/2-methoxy-6-polyprenyl-1,4-benzoquinol methylase
VDAGPALIGRDIAAMPFRDHFDCLWCGTAHVCRGPDDLEGWAQLCPDCVGKAGDNGFLRFRLRQALTERGAARAGSETAQTGTAGSIETVAEVREETPVPQPTEPGGPVTVATDMVAYYEARAPEYDDWYLRRGRYARGPIHDAAWNAELDAAGRWLDALPISGQIVELAAGTGWWSPLLASKGELSLYDAASAPLDRARDRLVAHGLRAHLHVRDAWAEPDREVDAVFAGFWLSHVSRDQIDAFLGLVRRWLRPGGAFAFIDSLLDLQSSAVDHPTPADDRSVRRLDDGREFTIVKVYYEPSELEHALRQAGFKDPSVTTTGRFFLTGTAVARDIG